MIQFKVNEMYYTIQGEGAQVGRPIVLIRLAGCDRKCPWCDTDHAKFEEHSTEEVVVSVQKWLNLHPECSSALITGGEPTLQPIELLARALHDAGVKWVGLETNGNRATTIIRHHFDYITLSAKDLDVRKGTAKGFPNEVRVVNDNTWSVDDLKLLADYYSYFTTTLFLSALHDNNKLDAFNFKDTLALLHALNKSIGKEGGRLWHLNIQMHKLMGLR